MSDRSLKPKIRNPILGLDAAKAIISLPLETRLVLVALLRDLSGDARARAERSWRQHKAPMAAYWKAVSVYSGHLHRIVRAGQPESGGRPHDTAAFGQDHDDG